MPPEPSANPSRPAVAAQEPYTKAQLTAMLAGVEPDLVERKETFEGEAPNTVRQTICAFANDLPNHRRPGVIFVGARDDGTPTGLDVHDALLLKLAHCKTDGNTAVEVGTARTEARRATYPLPALRELVRNAVMHRSYESGNSPIQLYWFDRHIEIINPGGAYGDVTPENSGQPGLLAYRNPNLADAMRVTGLVQRYGLGIPLVRRELRANQQPPPTYQVDSHWVRCSVQARADWPGFHQAGG